MKIKINNNYNIESKSNEINNNSRSLKLVNKNFLAGVSLIFFCIILFIIYTIVFKKDGKEVNGLDEKRVQAENLKQKELELKEKELQLREKEIASSNNNDNQLTIFLNNWISSHENGNDVSKFYSAVVYYYSAGFIPLNEVLDDKRIFFKKWDKRKFTFSNVSINSIDNNKRKIIYDKSFECENSTKKTFYNGKVRSVLVVQNFESEILINEEYDELIYYTNKD